MEKETYRLTTTEWQELRRLSTLATSTPVILIGGVDASATARQNVYNYWEMIGRKYGFDVDTVEAHDEAQREIRAVPIDTKDESEASS